MYVGELIKELQKHSSDKIVLISSDDKNYIELKSVITVKVSYKQTDKSEYNDLLPEDNLINAVFLTK